MSYTVRIFAGLAATAAMTGVPVPIASETSPVSAAAVGAPPGCKALETEIGREAGVSKVSAVVIDGANPATAYCQVELTYNSGKSGPKDGYAEGQSQAIGIRIGLPLRADDGGAGVWNGRIQNLGSGGCMGTLPSVVPATSHGYVGSSSDGGHSGTAGFNCSFALIPGQKQLNTGSIRDFTQEHVKWQTRWARKLAELYYASEPKFTYWSGCSQGGRQGHIALQTISGEVDGILAGGSGLYAMRFQIPQAWAGLVIKDVLRPLGKTLTVAQIDSTVKAEIAACDALDGVTDGELRDPRVCKWTARKAMCEAKGAPTANCLDADQARAFDMIRHGPVNEKGELQWFPWEPGTTFSTNTNYLASDAMMQLAVYDPAFKSQDHLYLNRATLKASGDPLGITYEDMVTLGTRRVSDYLDAVDMPPASVMNGKTKVISWTGTADRNIQSRNSIKYYRDVAAHLGTSITDPRYQSWYRLFLYPNVDHCGGGTGHQPNGMYSGPLFDALVAWVEKGQAPERILAARYENHASPYVAGTGKLLSSRPVCAYPRMAIYKGSGATTDAANFTCGGNFETRAALQQDRLAKFKFENGTGRVGPPYGP